MIDAEQRKALRFLIWESGGSMAWRGRLCARLPAVLAGQLQAMGRERAAQLEEIRIYAPGQVEWVFDGCRELAAIAVNMNEILACLSGQALYSCESQMAEGYISLPGGHRAGICGVMRCENGIWRMGEISSVCIRISRHIPGASTQIRAYLLNGAGLPQRVLLLGAPGCGKTTILRDAALWLACEQGLHVAVADEREELFAQVQGLPLDVMRAADKARTMPMLLRAMGPQVIVTDEIGREEDARAMEDAACCGAGVLASAHAGSMADARRRPVLRRMIEGGVFDRYLFLGRRGVLLAVCGADGMEIREEDDGRGQLGCGCDGHDDHQRDRLFALRR